MTPKELFKQWIELFTQGKADTMALLYHGNGEWAILEWKDPKGLRGCGFFHIIDNKIKLQRGYWDKLTFFKRA